MTNARAPGAGQGPHNGGLRKKKYEAVPPRFIVNVNSYPDPMCDATFCDVSGIVIMHSAQVKQRKRGSFLIVGKGSFDNLLYT